MGVEDETLRAAFGGAVTLAALTLLSAAPGCDNGAVGVDACREIEFARCGAVAGCPNSPVETEEDVEHCKLHYRDQCLFGMPDGINPDQPAVTGCVTALQLARRCWDGGQNLGDCIAAAAVDGAPAPTLVGGVDPTLTGCDAIMFPQILEACSFLEPPEPQQPQGSGGGGGAGGGGA